MTDPKEIEKLHNAAFDLLDLLEAVLEPRDGGGYLVRTDNADSLYAAVARLQESLGRPVQVTVEASR